jgi:hypothetical protein
MADADHSTDGKLRCECREPLQIGQTCAIGALRPGLSVDRARDILWTLIAMEVYDLLVIERDWSLDEWEAWVVESAAALLLGHTGGVGVG